MKTIKRLICIILIITMTAGVCITSKIPVYAKEKTAKVTKAVHMPLEEYNDEAVKVQFVNSGDHILNLKTNSKSLSAKVTKIQDDSNSGSNWAYIGLLTTKKGVYKVTFDIYNGKDKKISSHDIKVYVNNDYPVKKVLFDGEVVGNTITTKKSGKLSVKMNKGYTLKEIRIQTYDKDGNPRITKEKNDSKITLGKYPRASETNSEYYYRMYTNLFADTYITVCYKDKYTNRNEERGFFVIKKIID